MQVYAVYYTADGRFLIFAKGAMGYFFNSVPAPQGQALNGGGMTALPGGRQEAGETIEDTARREFAEETGVAIVNTLSVTEHTFDRFAAVYFEVGPDDFDAVANEIHDIRLPEAAAAAADIQAGRIRTKAQLLAAYPNAPVDNELVDIGVMNTHHAASWAGIAAIKGDPQVGWYYHVLTHFKDNVLAQLVAH